MHKIIEKFKLEIAKHGLTPPESITPGKFYRFPGINKPSGNRAAYCKLFEDSKGGVFGDFSSEISQTWFTNEQSCDLKIPQPTQFKPSTNSYAAAAKHAKIIVKNSKTADPNHPYIKLKGIKPYDIKQINGKLVLPIVDAYNNQTSLQYIFNTGYKQFFPEGKTKGCFAVIGDPTDLIYLCEGYATAATIHKATGKMVIAALSCGNLEAVAKNIKEKYFDSIILVCGDNDKNGIDCALKSAKILDKAGDPIIPCFSKKNIDKKFNDFNDLMLLEGIETVRNQILERTRELTKTSQSE